MRKSKLAVAFYKQAAINISILFLLSSKKLNFLKFFYYYLLINQNKTLPAFFGG